MFSLWVVGCSPTSQPEPSKEAKPSASQAPKKIEFIVYTAKWCEVCNKVPPLLTDLRKEFPTVVFRDLDVDQKENFEQYVKSKPEDVGFGLPFMVLFEEGKVINHWYGYHPYEQIANVLQDKVGSRASASQ